MRHISIQGTILEPRFERVRVQVLSLTHFDTDFSSVPCSQGRWNRPTRAFSHEDFIIFSLAETYGGDYIDYTLNREGKRIKKFFLGQPGRLTTLTVTLEEFNQIKACVEAYNEFHKDK